MYYKARSYRVFELVNYMLLITISILCVAPIVHVFAISLSGQAVANANLVSFWPVDVTWDAYGKTLGNDNFLRALWIGIERTVLGTVISMILIGLASYALSKDGSIFRFRSIYIWYFVFTMFFYGGMIPTYILVQKLGLLNSLGALVLPAAVNVWNMILLINFFKTVPKELEEAAFIDGANHIVTLIRIFLPISMPAIATLSLFTMVINWNTWFDGLIYITDYRKYPLATFLQTIIVQQDFSKTNIDPSQIKDISERTVKSAQIFIGALPILLVYPFLQKYFVKGVVLGAVKE